MSQACRDDKVLTRHWLVTGCYVKGTTPSRCSGESWIAIFMA